MLKSKHLGCIAIYTIPWLIFYMFSIGRIIISNWCTVLHATDLEIPPSNPTYYFWSLWYPYHPMWFGSTKVFKLHEILYGIVLLITRSPCISQYIILSLPPLISYITMLHLLRNNLKIDRFPSILGAILFAFSPVYIAWYTQPYFIGYSWLPLLLIVVNNLNIQVRRNNLNSLKEYIQYVISFSVIISWIISLLFQIFPILIAYIFIYIALTSIRPNRFTSFLKAEIIFLFSLLILPLVSPRTLDILTISGKTAMLESQQLISPYKIYYEKARMINLIKLAGGTSFNKAFKYFNSNHIGLIIPLIAFSGLFSVNLNKKFEKLSIKTITYIIAVIETVTLLLMIKVVLFILSLPEIPLWLTLILSTIRRPERVLMLLSLNYGIMLAYSTETIIKCIKTRQRQYKPSATIIYRQKIKISSIVIILILFVVYLQYLNIYSPDIFSYHYEPRPRQYMVVKEFLNKYVGSQPLSFRYLILPLYIQIMAEERYDHPSLAYSSMYAGKLSWEYFMELLDAINNANYGIAYILGLGSVKYVVVLSKNLTETEFASWRFKGKIRTEGASLFGDPNIFNDLLRETEGISIFGNIGDAIVYANTKVLPLIYAGDQLIITSERSSWRLLPVIDAMFNLSNTYVMFESSYNLGENITSFIDYSKGVRAELLSLPLDIYYHYTDFEFSAKQIMGSLKVWGRNISVSFDPKEESIIVSAIPSENKNYVSIWINLPNFSVPTYSLDSISINGEFHARDVYLRLVTMDYHTVLNEKLNHNVERVFEKTVEKVYLSFDPRLRLIALTLVASDKNTPVSIVLRSIKVKLIDRTIVPLSGINATEFNSADGLILLIEAPAEINYVSELLEKHGFYVKYLGGRVFMLNVSHLDSELLTLPYYVKISFLGAISVKNNGFQAMVNYKIARDDPNNIVMKVNITLMAKTLMLTDNIDFFLPIFFGYTYSKDWHLHVQALKGDIINIDHLNGNMYGNLWLVKMRYNKIANHSIYTDTLELSIYYSSTTLIMYRFYSSVVLLLHFYGFAIIFNLANVIIRLKKLWGKPLGTN